jgi:ribosomal protein S18 acetylase RimI-like enzyme
MAGSFDGLYKVQKKDTQRAAATFVDAFQHDPIWNAVFANHKSEDRRVHAVYETPVKYCLRYGSVYSTSEELEGVAAWAPGELSDMALWRLIRCGGARSGMKIGLKIAKQMMPIFRPIEMDKKENMKGKDYIYLFIVGVAQKHQGQGFGGNLLRALITESERTGKALYLETETQKNVEMYDRLGFKLIKKITLPIVDLPMWEMVREAGA